MGGGGGGLFVTGNFAIQNENILYISLTIIANMNSSRMSYELMLTRSPELAI